MIKIHFVVPVMFCFTVLSCSTVETSKTRKLDSAICNILDSADIPGLSIAFINDGMVDYSGAFGYKNDTVDEKVNSKTCFEAASLTKPVTAYCAMRLAEAGELSIDTPLYKYLEYEPIEYDDRYKLITARMVMCHTSGFPNWRRFNKDNKLDIKFTPGTRYGYSGEGYVYLQKVIEKITGIGLDSVADELVFNPLGMDHSSLVFPGTDNYAIGHDIERIPGDKFKPEEPNGAATLHTTASDYSKFLQEILEPEHINKSWIDKMTIPHIPLPEADSSVSFGLGFGLQIHNRDTLLWHWGDNRIFKAFCIVSKNTGRGFVYFANSENGLSIINRLVGIVYGDPEIMAGWGNQYNEPGFVLRKYYIMHGPDSVFDRFSSFKISVPGSVNEDILNELGYFVLRRGDTINAIKIFRYNLNEYPNSKDAAKMIRTLPSSLIFQSTQ